MSADICTYNGIPIADLRRMSEVLKYLRQQELLTFPEMYNQVSDIIGCCAEPAGPGTNSSPGSEAVCLAETSLPSLPAATGLSLPLPTSSFGPSGGAASQITTVMPMAPTLLGAQPKESRPRDSKAEVRRARRYSFQLFLASVSVSGILAVIGVMGFCSRVQYSL